MAKPKPPLPDAASTAWPSLGDALRARGLQVGESAETTEAPPPSRDPGGAVVLPRGGKIVLRRERKSHGGKTVTVVDGVHVPVGQLETIARMLRMALGCGGWVDAGKVLLQGDVAAGAEAWLHAHGATRVIVGN